MPRWDNPPRRLISALQRIARDRRERGQDDISRETVESVLPGRAVINGQMVPIAGEQVVRAGQRVYVYNTNGRPTVVIAHSARRSQYGPRPLIEEGVVEELFVAVDDEGPDVYFRNDQQVSRLNLRAFTGVATKFAIGWGLNPRTFWLASGDPATAATFAIHVFSLNFGPEELYGANTPEVSLLYTWRPADLGTLNLATINFTGLVSGFWGPTELTAPNVKNVVSILWSDTMDVEAQNASSKGVVKVRSVVLDEVPDLHLLLEVDVETLRKAGPVFPRNVVGMAIPPANLLDLSTPKIGASAGSSGANADLSGLPEQTFPHPPWASGLATFWTMDKILEDVNCPNDATRSGWEIKPGKHLFLVKVTTAPTVEWRSMKHPFDFRLEHIFEDGVITSFCSGTVPGTTGVFNITNPGPCTFASGQEVQVDGVIVRSEQATRKSGLVKVGPSYAGSNTTRRDPIDYVSFGLPQDIDPMTLGVVDEEVKLESVNAGAGMAYGRLVETGTCAPPDSLQQFLGAQCATLLAQTAAQLATLGCPTHSNPCVTTIEGRVQALQAKTIRFRLQRRNLYDFTTHFPVYAGRRTTGPQAVPGHLLIAALRFDRTHDFAQQLVLSGSLAIPATSPGTCSAHSIVLSPDGQGDIVTGAEKNAATKRTYAAALRNLATWLILREDQAAAETLLTFGYLPSNEFHVHWIQQPGIFLAQMSTGITQAIGSDIAEYLTRKFVIVRPDQFYRSEEGRFSFVTAWDRETGQPTLVQPDYLEDSILADLGGLEALGGVVPLVDTEPTPPAEVSSFQAINDPSTGVDLGPE